MSELSSQAATILVLQQGFTDVADDLWNLNGVQELEYRQTADGQEYRITGNNPEDLRPAVFDIARTHNWPLRELRREVRTLESVFNELVSEGGNGINEADVEDEQ